MRKTFARFLLVLSSVFVSIVASELGLRLFLFGTFSTPRFDTIHGLRDPHPARGWTLAPNKRAYERTRDYAVTWTTNSRGLRDVEHNLGPRHDVARIVVLGDSFMEARQVPLEQSFHRQLERLLGKDAVEVINLGVGGYGTTQELLYFQEEGALYHPDLVLLATYLENDVRNNHPRLERLLWGRRTIKTVGRPFVERGPDSRLRIRTPDFDTVRDLVIENRERARWKEDRFLSNTALGELFDRASARARQLSTRLPRYDPNVWLGVHLASFVPECGKTGLSRNDYAELWNEAWANTEWSIAELDRVVQEQGAKLVVFTVPSRIQIEKELQQELKAQCGSLVFDMDRSHQKLNTIGQRVEVDVLDLLPSFLEVERENPGALYFQVQNRHWNENGHALAAQIVARFLKEEHLVPMASEDP